MNPLSAVLTFVIAERLAELVWATRNTRRLLAEGAHEVGAGHYPLLVGLHAAWIITIAVTIPPDRPLLPIWAAVFMLLLAARVWVITTLGRLWTTRIITAPNLPVVRSGPYRWLRHPNYLVVAGEIAALPLMFGAWRIAALFSVLNAALLWHRITIEDTALASRRVETSQ